MPEAVSGIAREYLMRHLPPGVPVAIDGNSDENTLSSAVLGSEQAEGAELPSGGPAADPRLHLNDHALG